MVLDWQMCQGNVWGTLHGVDLSHSHFDRMEGVYIIWKGNGPVIRIGQGVIRDRLRAHRDDRAINAHDNLHVTWAPVVAAYRDAVEKFLANTLRPVVGDAFPLAQPIPVNLPWAWS